MQVFVWCHINEDSNLQVFVLCPIDEDSNLQVFVWCLINEDSSLYLQVFVWCPNWVNCSKLVYTEAKPKDYKESKLLG